MHEQSIVESLLTIALENAAKAKASKILRIYVVIGDLSGVIEEAMDFYFGFLRQNTVAAEASLAFRRVPARLHCRNCNIDFTAANFDFHCPNCRETQVEITGGRELYIESMEVE